MTRSFRAAAEQRISELEQRDQDRHVRAGHDTARKPATQRAEPERRDAQPTPADQAVAEQRTRLAQRFGQHAADRLNVRSEYYLFLVLPRNVAVAFARPEEAHHPGGHAPRRTPVLAVRCRGASWDHQLALQRGLGVGVDPPVIVYGNQLLAAALDIDRLLIDPSEADLRSYA